MENLDKHMFSNILNHLFPGILIRKTSGDVIYCNNSAAEYFNADVSKLLSCHGDFLLKEGYVDHSFTDIVLQTKKSITYQQNTASEKKSNQLYRSNFGQKRKGSLCDGAIFFSR